MKTRDLFQLGIPGGETLEVALRSIREAAAGGMKSAAIRKVVKAVAADPAAHVEDAHFGELARRLIELGEARRASVRREPARWKRWGDDIDETAIRQMSAANRLPVSVRGALMPDAHPGYGQPIGGVLATRNAVIPYAVGVDIACRVRLTVLDLPVKMLDEKPGPLERAINEETRFGIGAVFTRPRTHEVMDEDWSITVVTARAHDRAWRQLGTSGSGNHFVEFGVLTLKRPELGLEPGRYLALLSHSGSRAAGLAVANHYSRLAMRLHPELPKELQHLAWLDLDTEPGQEYWQAMELMGRYAAANHELIHHHILRNLGARALFAIENHHNFAWREVHDGEELIVHRKGATPAGAGELGVIPGSMAAPGYVVRGRGVAESLNSASHGAGRRMSRAAARSSFTWHAVRKLLAERGVRVLSADLDEAPMAYKDIDEVMRAQGDLVEPIARFDPRLVKMAPAGERPED